MPPVAILGVTLAATAISTGLSVSAARAQGKSAEDTANFNAQVAENNATLVKQQAEVDSERIRRRNKRVRGTQIANATKNGLLISGSVSDIMFDSDLRGEFDVLNTFIRGNVTAANLKSEAGLLRAQGRNARKQGNLKAGASIATGAAGTAGAVSTFRANRASNPELN